MKVKKYIPLFFFIISISIQAQDTTYFNANNKKVKSLKLATYYNVITTDPTDTLRKTYKDYFISGQLKREFHFRIKLKDDKKIETIIEGKLNKWYESGKLLRESVYKNGEMNGQNIAYWENGKIKRNEKYTNGKLINGKSFDSDGKEIEFSLFDEMPEFPGGQNVLMDYISNNLKYPVEMQKMGIQGKSIVRFVVQKDGSISNIEILRSATPGLDEEAIRVVKSLPKWKPGMLDGEPVSVYYTLPINFRLKN